MSVRRGPGRKVPCTYPRDHRPNQVEPVAELVEIILDVVRRTPTTDDPAQMC